MADDATVPPSAARIRRAWAAGRRPSSMWLPVGLALLGTAGLLAWWRPDVAAFTSTLRDALVRGGDGSGDLVIAAFGAALVGAGFVAAIVALAIVGAGLLQGRLGPVDPELEVRLAAPPSRSPMLFGMVLAAVLLAITAGDVLALVVGGSRAADASEAALDRLWQQGALRLVVALGLGACVIGLVESWWSRRAELVALALTPAQARDEARERRGRRR
jgi:hypothetical protein